MAFQLSYFKSWKRSCETAALNMPANLKNSAVATGLERSVFIPIPKKGNAKECSNYHTIALISHSSKVMLKILQARLQQYMNLELPDVQAGLRKDQGSDQISRSVVSNSLRPHESQHARPPCPSPTPGIHSDSRPSSQWCHPAISSSVVPFSSCPNPSQHQSLFQWVNSSYEVAKVLEFQL